MDTERLQQFQALIALEPHDTVLRFGLENCISRRGFCERGRAIAEIVRLIHSIPPRIAISGRPMRLDRPQKLKQSFSRDHVAEAREICKRRRRCRCSAPFAQTCLLKQADNAVLPLVRASLPHGGSNVPADTKKCLYHDVTLCKVIFQWRMSGGSHGHYTYLLYEKSVASSVSR